MFVVSLIIIVLLTAADQLLKFLVVKKIPFAEIVKVIRIGGRDIFSLTYITNDGAAWSMMSGKTWFLIGLPTVVIIGALIYIFLKRKDSKLQLISLSLIVSGGLGNLIDRVRSGKVVDYILFEPIDFPVFNLADICVVIGAVIFCIWVIFSDSVSKKKADTAAQDTQTDKEEQNGEG